MKPLKTCKSVFQLYKLKLLIIFVSLFCHFSCIKDPCTSIFCDNSGECVNGNCLCTDGYVNENCSETIASLMVGNYTVTTNCSDSIISDSTYTAIISTNASFNSTKGIKVENLLPAYPDFELNGIITNLDSLYFENQTVSLVFDTLYNVYLTNVLSIDTLTNVAILDTIRIDEWLNIDALIATEELNNLQQEYHADAVLVENLYQYNIIISEGIAWNDSSNGNINLEIEYKINGLLVTCTQLFIKE